MALFQIDTMSRTPIYTQIIEQLERFILTGAMTAGGQMPSVRGLSLELSINPNTILKAYSELDTRGLICSVPGRGYFVRENAREMLADYIRGRLGNFSDEVKYLALAGIGKDELITIIENNYGGNANDKG